MAAGTELRTEALQVERRSNPIGIDEVRPWLSWRVIAASGTPYTGYQVQAAADADFADIWWDSDYQDDPAAGVRYGGEPLASRQGAYWRVRAFSSEDAAGPWSDVAFFEIGLLLATEWVGQWIGIADDVTGVPIHLRTEFHIPGEAHRSRLYVSALGWVRVFVDGVDLTEGTLVPRFTPYDSEVEYVTFDLGTPTEGAHTVDLVIGDGRFRGALGIHGVRNVYGDRLGALVHAEFDLSDGTRHTVGSNVDWSGGHGARTFADPKDGESIDLTQLACEHTEHITHRSTVVALPPHPRVLTAERTDRLRAISTLPAREILPQGDGSVLIDFGQNIAGVVRLRVTEAAGTRITLQHAEDVTVDGELEWEHLDREGVGRKDRPRRFQMDEIIADGDSRWVQPWFTIHGFRYVKISGLTAAVEPDGIEAVVLSSVDVSPAAFSSSDKRLNHLYSNAVWSMMGNFLDTPTDCPQRERGGFTGDAQIFAPTATALGDVTTFFARYLRSLQLDQLGDGRIPMVVPREYSPFSGDPKGMTVKAAGSVGWGDAAVLLPWTIYEATGDPQILRDQFSSMVAWVEYLRRRGARKGFIWGEWIRAGENPTLGAMRDNSINRKNIGLAYLAHSADVLAKVARTIGRVDDAARYTQVAEDTRAAWQKVAVRRHGRRIGTDRQDDYVRALAFDLLSAQERDHAAARLAELVTTSGRIGTGFLSTALLLPTLTSIGRRDLAYMLLLQEEAPSWLGQVAKGATTVWENWTEPGRKGARIGSSNHYSFGSVVSWLISGVVGLSAETPGRRHIRFAPEPGGTLTHARAELYTDFGAVHAEWLLEADELRARITLPVGVDATVVLGATKHHLSHGTHELREGIHSLAVSTSGDA